MLYCCSKCQREVKVDHINPPVFTCGCVDVAANAFMKGSMYGRSSFGESKTNNNISEASAMILRNTLFAIAANEFFLNKKDGIEAKDLRVKDTETGREFSFTLTGKEL